jgi:hypothetical protein
MLSGKALVKNIWPNGQNTGQMVRLFSITACLLNFGSRSVDLPHLSRNSKQDHIILNRKTKKNLNPNSDDYFTHISQFLSFELTRE